jgi:MFS family permease
MGPENAQPFVFQTASSMDFSAANKETEISPVTPTSHLDFPMDELDSSRPKDSNQPVVTMNVFQEILFVGVVAISHFMTQAAFAQALAPINIIANSFPDMTPHGGAWFVSGYALTAGTFILISGRLGDIVGHSSVFILGYVWFGVWSGFAGFAAYPGRQIFFIFCRAMQGVGPALLVPNGLALLARAYPPGIKKNIMFSLFGCAAPAGFVTGATFGSIFTRFVWWPWTFWSFGFVCFGLSALCFVAIPSALQGKPSGSPHIGFDWAGSVSGVIGLVFVNIAFNNAPLYSWATPHVHVSLICGLIFLIGFVWIEFRAKHPLLPVHGLNSTVFWMLGCVAFGWGCFGIWLMYSWRFLEEIRGLSPLAVSAQFGPAPVSGLLASIITGLMLSKTPVSLVNLMSMIFFTIGVTIAATLPVQQSYWYQAFFSIALMPFGMDLSFPAATIVLSNHMPPEHQGLAASLVVTTINYSISIALGIAGTIEKSVVTHSIISNGDTSLKGIQAGLEHAHLKGIQAGFYTGSVYALIGVFLGLLFFVRTIVKEGWKVQH